MIEDLRLDERETSGVKLRDPSQVPRSPAASVPLRRQLSYRQAIRSVWHSKHLIRSLAERDLRVRYKQATLGMAWTLLNPIILLIAFTVIFERAVHINTNGVPYPLFAYVGLLPWTFFSEAVAMGSGAIVAEKTLLNKVQFPRESFVMAKVCVAAADTLMATIALVGLFVIEGFLPKSTSYWALILIPIMVPFVAGVPLAFSALVVYFRDMSQVVPVILQLGLFATPVAYSFSLVPKDLQPLYALINPLGPVIDGLRESVLYGNAPSVLPVAVAAVSSVLYLCGGYALFKRMEMGFADIA